MRKPRTYTISAVAAQYDIHAQTLRMYEREGLLKPSRSDGNTRLYTDEDLARLELILNLTRDLGVNLAGVEIILNMREKMNDMRAEFQGFLTYLNQHADEFIATTARAADRDSDEKTDALIPTSRAAGLRVVRRQSSQ